MEEFQQVSQHIEAAMDALQVATSSNTITIVIVILTAFLCLLFSASIMKRLMDNVCGSKLESQEETYFSYFPTSFNSKAAKRILDEVGHYIPPWWYSSDLGTIIAFGKDFECHYDEEIVEAADGCRFIVSWYPHRPYHNTDLDNTPILIGDNHNHISTERTRVVLYVPGLGLHADSKVSKNYALRMAQRGYTVGIVGVRGERLPLTCHTLHKNHHHHHPNSNSNHSVLRPWHPALIDDLLATILRIHKLLPTASLSDTLDIFLTGYSAGGNIVQKTLQAMHQQNLRKRHAHHPSLSIKNLDQHRHGENTSRDEMEDKEQQLVRAAFVLCLNFDYLPALRRLEQTLMGKIYSFCMCRVSTDILKKHRSELLQFLQLHSEENTEEVRLLMDELFPADTAAHAALPSFQWQWLFGSDANANSKNSGLLSDFDQHVWKLRGFHSVEEQFQAFSMFEASAIAIPTLMLQPRDDPLHLKNALANLDLAFLKSNKALLFMSPKHGNHFGFYEGSLWQAICGTNTECYSYPAKVSNSFFETALEDYLAGTHHERNHAVQDIRRLQLREMRLHDNSSPHHSPIVPNKIKNSNNVAKTPVRRSLRNMNHQSNIDDTMENSATKKRNRSRSRNRSKIL